MIHRYKHDAARELLAAVEHYEFERAGLGGEFLDEIDRAIDSIKEAPSRWPTKQKGTRRYRLNRFPYNVIYYFKDAVVVIVAIAHQHRQPEYWTERLD